MIRRLVLVLLVLTLALVAQPGTASSLPDAVAPFRDVVRPSVPARAAALGTWALPPRARLAMAPADVLGTLLRRAPAEGTTRPPLVLELPLPDGSSSRFAVRESLVVSPELAARMPGTRTFTAEGLDDPATTGRLDLTPAGFHAILLSPSSTVYIDPVPGGDGMTVAILDKRDALAGEPLLCQVASDRDTLSPARRFAALAVDVSGPLVSPTSLRVARVAVSASSSYTAFHGGQAGAEAALVTLLNRVNAIYERDLSLRLVLTGTVVFTDEATDPFKGLSGAEAIITKNIQVLGERLGNATFDIGHHVGVGGGGVALLGSICDPENKAGGYTLGNPPTGDPYVVDFVAHELGHQLGANHSYNAASGGSCTTRNEATAFEALSGVTIMSYTNICDGVDVAPQADDLFHAVSLKEILETLAQNGSCFPATGGYNSPPAVTAPGPVTIPAGTPFTLTASGSDPDAADASRLTWSFEQYDLGPASNVVGDTGRGPLVKTFKPSTSPSRTFPRWQTILSSSNVAPTTYVVGEKTYFNPEALPATDRTLKFRIVVRDNRTADGRVGGAVTSADASVTVVASAGPFRVSEPNTSVTWAAGEARTIRWDVARTDQAPISAANVRITLSVDGGGTFGTVLAGSVPNSGEAQVTVPASVAATTNARVKVEAAGNVFFDVSDTDFNISGGTAGAPVASFTASPEAPLAGQAVTFTDTSTGGPTSWTWTFGDGSSSTDRNPVKTWATAGTYTVELTVANAQGQNAASRQITVGPSTSGPASSAFFVPVVLSSSGAAGSFYTSELTLTNRGSTTATVTFDYTAVAGGGSGSSSTAEALSPGRQKVIPNAIEYLRGLGVPLPADGNRVGTLRVKFSGLSDDNDAAVTVRTATAVAQPAGRAGLSYPGVAASRALTGTAYIGGLRYSTTQDRSNVAVQNAGSAGDVTLRVTVVSGNPAEPFQKTLDDLTLGPGGFRQYGPADMGLADGFQGWARIQRVGGTEPWFAYGVVNDQANSDGSFVPPVSLEGAGGASGQTLPVIVETSTFSSEVAIANLGTAGKTARLTLVPTSGGEYSWAVTLAPGEQRVLPEFVKFLRQSGVAVPEGTIVGPLFLSVPGGDARGLFLGARTSAPGGGGRFGLFYVAVPAGSAATGSAWLNALQQNADNRTNVAFINTGERDTSPIALRLEVFDGDTGRKVATVEDTLSALVARGFKQENGILGRYGVTQGYVRVTRTSGRNPFVCYAVINDGGVPNQRTDDGAFVPNDLPPQPVE